MRAKFASATSSTPVMVRVLPGQDLIEGIEDVCNHLGIRSGSIACCIGSLQKASLMFLVPSQNKVGAAYTDPQTIPGPLQIVSAQGVIGQDRGAIFIHMHGLLVDKTGNVHGGHLIRGGTPVLITSDIVVARIEGAQLRRAYDPEVEFKLLSPVEDQQ